MASFNLDLTDRVQQVISASICAATFFALRVSGWTKKNCPREHSVEWDSRVMGFIHGALQTVLAIFCLHEAKDYTDEEMVWGHSLIPITSCNIFIGFIAYDIVIVLAYKEIREVATIIHHTVFISLALICCHFYFLKFAFAWLMLTEASTPSLHIRWFMDVSGAKGNPWYIYNGLALTVIFFVVRVVFYGLGLAHMFLYLLPEINKAPHPVMRVVPYVVAAGYALNLFWFNKLFRGAMKVLSGKTKKK